MSHRDAQPRTVYLTGAGPGAPDLRTLRAACLLAQADIVVYDNLVTKAVLDLVPAQAERIYAGKQRGNHAVLQDALNLLRVQLAKRNLRVVRLKGGDPYILGRGGEEAETLAAHDVPFQAIQGITAASGVSA